MSEDTYTCAMCGGTFEKGQDDETALEESEALFGRHNSEELEVVCEDCWQKIHPLRN